MKYTGRFDAGDQQSHLKGKKKKKDKTVLKGRIR